jgi:hypothetical protein
VFDNGVEYPPLIVTSCPSLLAQLDEAEQSLVIDALHRVADAVLQIYAHYRFYCYTQSSIGDDPNYQGPAQTVLDSMPDYIADPTDPNFGKWRDWTGFT